MPNGVEQRSSQEEIEFISADGLAQLETAFEEEFKANPEYTRIVGGSGSSTSLSTNSAWLPTASDLTEDPIAHGTADA